MRPPVPPTLGGSGGPVPKQDHTHAGPTHAGPRTLHLGVRPWPGQPLGLGVVSTHHGTFPSILFPRSGGVQRAAETPPSPRCASRGWGHLRRHVCEPGRTSSSEVCPALLSCFESREAGRPSWNARLSSFPSHFALLSAAPAGPTLWPSQPHKLTAEGSVLVVLPSLLHS